MGEGGVAVVTPGVAAAAVGMAKEGSVEGDGGRDGGGATTVAVAVAVAVDGMEGGVVA